MLVSSLPLQPPNKNRPRQPRTHTEGERSAFVQPKLRPRMHGALLDCSARVTVQRSERMVSRNFLVVPLRYWYCTVHSPMVL